MSQDTSHSPFFSFLKFLFFAALVFGAFSVGDNIGYKRGFKETANFTLSKLGFEKPVETQNEYDMTLDNYIKNNDIKVLLSPENISGKASNLIKNLLNRLFE